MCNVLIPDVKKYINFSREIHKELHHSMAHQKRYIYIYIYIQGVPGGRDKTSGVCSLC